MNLAPYKKTILEIIILTLVLIFQILLSSYNYLIFHAITELFSITIACMIFVITWNARNEIDNRFLLIFGSSSLFIGFLDLIHTLAYKGMGVFLEYDANLPTQLWIAARYLQAFSILFASLITKKKINIYFLVSSYLLTTTIVTISIFGGMFPDSFIEGHGLTPFKIISEYIIIVMLAFSLILLYLKRLNFNRKIFQLITFSIIITIFSEFSFTLYQQDVFGFFNLIGHIFKIIAFYLIYKAIIQEGLKDPINLLFRKIKTSEENYREAYNKVNFYKDLFTHDISNIFQNLISSFELSNKLGKDKSKSDQSNKIKEIINGQLMRGKELIENIRKLSRIEDSEIPARPTDLSKMLKTSIEFIQKSFSEREVNVRIDSFNGHIQVNANELLIDVFENILINAINYNLNEVIDINVKLSRFKEEGTNYIKMEFIDNGIGIEDSRKQLIFERGYKKEKGSKGMGLGLSLIVEILRSYNGKIWVEDRIKGDHAKGSKFILVIPEA